MRLSLPRLNAPQVDAGLLFLRVIFGAIALCGPGHWSLAGALGRNTY